MGAGAGKQKKNDTKQPPIAKGNGQGKHTGKAATEKLAARDEWDEGEYLPGKKEGADAFVKGVWRRWDAAQAEVRADWGEYEALRAAGEFKDVSWTLGNGNGRTVVPKPYWRKGRAIKETEFRAMTLSQIYMVVALMAHVFKSNVYVDSFKKGKPRIDFFSANLYAINEHIVMPLTKRFKCSFVELVAGGEQRPQWFVSHWWGTPFRETVFLLTWHAKVRELGTSARYWICTFANNQHSLGELAGGLLDTPFVRAMLDPGCVGTVAVFNKEATTFKRIWCVLEGQVSLLHVKRSKPDYLYDLAAMKIAEKFGPCVMKDMGNDEVEDHCEVDKCFPLHVSAQALKTRVQNADASRDCDRRNILHHVVGTPEHSREEQPPLEHPKYDELNNFMRRRFAVYALTNAVLWGDKAGVQQVTEEFPEVAHKVIPFAHRKIWLNAGIKKQILAMLEAAAAKAPAN